MSDIDAEMVAARPCGVLYIVATPIGNLEDMSYRAVRILREVALVAAEDTRHSRKLFAHFGITTPLTSCFSHNEMRKGEHLVQRLLQGEDVALISDAGTPAISDPGEVLVQLCIEEGIRVVPVPGACAVVAALSAAGLPTDVFTFVGFVPAKRTQRLEFLTCWGDKQHTVIAYEAPHRLGACLTDICSVLGDERGLVVARELTKVHEEIFRGSAAQALQHFSVQKVRGELVLLLEPLPEKPLTETVEELIRRLLRDEHMSVRRISKEAARIYPLSGSEAYALTLQLQQEMGQQGG